MKTFYATTPIYYVNDLPHIGHIYTTVVTDVVTRYRRLVGEKTRFLTGTDEHGQNIAKAAAAQGITPIQLADRVVERYRELYRTFEIRNDDFIRTTEARHRRGVEALIARIAASGDFYTAKHEGWYCSSCEAFYTEKELDAEKACPVHGTPTVWESEENVFFRLSKYAGAAARALRGPPGLRAPGEPAGRGRLLRARRASTTSRSRARRCSGESRFPGIPATSSTSGSTRSRTTLRPSGSAPRTATACTGSSGTTPRRSVSTSSARTSCGSMPSTGRRSCSRRACPCRRPSGRTAGGCAMRRRSPSRWGTSCGPMRSSRSSVRMRFATFCCARWPSGSTPASPTRPS